MSSMILLRGLYPALCRLALGGERPHDDQLHWRGCLCSRGRNIYTYMYM